jgi:hypothetical protein
MEMKSSPKYQVVDSDDADGLDEDKIRSGAQITVRQNGGSGELIWEQADFVNDCNPMYQDQASDQVLQTLAVSALKMANVVTIK